jgi:DnaJ like chaperone protein
MSLWVTIIGGAAGFALGGPLGGLLGAAAGHAVDLYRDGDLIEAEPEDNTRKIAFTIGVIALAAKMAKADGEVTRDEIAAFREIFTVDADEIENVNRIFDLARRDAAGFESYAKQIAKLFPPASPVLEQLLDGLFHIAKADGKVPQAEIDYLRRVASIFGFDEGSFERIRRTQLGIEFCANDPYCVLGVSLADSETVVKAAYRRLVRENHPDTLMAQGLPQEAIASANAKLALFNTAWETIRSKRGWK